MHPPSSPIGLHKLLIVILELKLISSSNNSFDFVEVSMSLTIKLLWYIWKLL